MACLAPPQFKWPPSTRASVFREPAAAGGSSRPVRVHCAAASSTAVLDEERAESLTVSFGEALLNREAVVEAAAAEAVALARAAAEFAREVARTARTDHRPDVPRREAEPAEEDSFLAKEVRRTEVGWETRHFLQEEEEFSSIFSDESEDDDEEQCVQGVVAVRSARRTERRARRESAAMKAAKSVRVRAPVGSSSRKKRLKGCRSPLGCLYKMAGQKLLTKKQEIQYSEGIQDLLKLEAIQKDIAQSNGSEPTFSEWAAAAGTDESTLRKRLIYGGYCKKRMVESNVRLVISIAREFEGPGTEFSDLIQAGIRGLVRGAEKFDASKGFRFSTYSHWWIKQAIRKSVTEQTQLVHLPAQLAESSSRARECLRRLRDELNRLPTNEEIAQDTGMSIRRVVAALRLPRYTVSLCTKVGSTDLTYQDVMADTSAETAEEMMHRLFMKQDVDRALDCLNPREKMVMRYRFGIEGGRPKTLHAIGKMMGVSRERIRQMELAAFRKLRSEESVQSLEHYLLHPPQAW